MSKHPRQITLLNVWSEQNRGDFAILVSTIKLLQDKLKLTDKDKINLVFIGIDSQTIQKLIDDKQFIELKKYNLYGAPVPFLTYKNKKLVSLHILKKIFNILISLFNLVLKQGKIFELLQGSDINIAVGGHYLFSFYQNDPIKELLSLYAIGFPFLAAQRIKRRIKLMGVSIGPFYHQVSEKLLKIMLKNHKIYVREKFTFSYLKKLELSSTIIPDIAFYLQYKKRLYKKIDPKAPKIGITIRDWPFPEVKDIDQRKKKVIEYKKQIALLCKNILKKYPKAELTFYPQISIPSEREDDRVIMREVESLIKPHSKHIKFYYEQIPLKTLVEEYQKKDVIIGTRMHSLILGIPTPFIPIAYMGKKTHGLVKLLGYPDELIINITEVNAKKLLQHLDFVLKNHKALFSLLKSKKHKLRKLLFNACLV